MDYHFYLPVRLLCGRDAVCRESARFAALGARCLLVTGRAAARKSGALADVTAALDSQGIAWRVFDEIGANPLLQDCERAAQACAGFGADFVVGIGGGSPMDAAKAVAVLAANPGMSGASLYSSAPRKRALPIVLVGTTSGTGSEVSAVSVLTDASGRKRSIKGDDLYAAFAFGDPKYTFTMSRAETISTGLDAFCHAMEGYLSPHCDRISASLAEGCLPSLWRALLALHEGEPLTEAMHESLYEDSLTAGLVLNTLGTAYPHPLGYVLTERFGIPHGRACAVFAPSLLRLALDRGCTHAQRLLDLLGVPLQRFSEVFSELADCASIRMTDEEIDALRGRLTGVKNYANVPGGFDEEQALTLLRRLFGRQTRILLVRHGESVGNDMGIFQGHIDCDVSENGKKQLDLLSIRLRNVPLDAIATSPLLRARRTAEGINRFHHLPVEIYDDLIEIDGGDYNGTLWSELPARFPEQNDKWYHDPANFEAPHGDAMREVYERIWRGLLAVVRDHRGQTVCVVSHGSAIRNAICRILYGTIDRLGDTPWSDNTGFSTIDFADDDTPRIVKLNDASHLTPETSSMAKQDWWDA